ncbi:antitoxin CptB [Gemmobacter megaterium]|uniref:FAD assembly factor SdhE n=1 Tax=Gemmobacter megaterium TaxID=1086013 RepID=A0A1N7PY54_9RHOB|nr:succinate dehydrogenase assembly factor 2 [Gemmobacter megaterium]GGE22237.1 succinate dehydrogenase assembly factor 2 [Gemmobacter megaterium]SIT15520.1 antitoxin CptB [Gemmobacter megaterium]
MSEPLDARLKRMRMRSWRRGTKEMDMVLGPYADARLSGMDTRALDAFDALLEEYDQDLIKWVLGQEPAPPEHSALIADLAAFARARLAPGP